MKTTVDNLDQAVMEELDKYAGMLPDEIEAAQKAVAKTVVKQLKTTSPKRGKQRYAKGWKSTTTKTRTGAETVIYQGKLPGLPHLLEFGHPKVNGGRTKAIPHIQPAEQEAIRLYEDEIGRRL